MAFMRRKHQLLSSLLDWSSTLLISATISITVTTLHAIFDYLSEIRNSFVKGLILPSSSWSSGGVGGEGGVEGHYNESLFKAWVADAGLMLIMVSAACLLTAWQVSSS